MTTRSGTQRQLARSSHFGPKSSCWSELARDGLARAATTGTGRTGIVCGGGGGGGGGGELAWVGDQRGGGGGGRTGMSDELAWGVGDELACGANWHGGVGWRANWHGRNWHVGRTGMKGIGMRGQNWNG